MGAWEEFFAALSDLATHVVTHPLRVAADGVLVPHHLGLVEVHAELGLAKEAQDRLLDLLDVCPLREEFPLPRVKKSLGQVFYPVALLPVAVFIAEDSIRRPTWISTLALLVQGDHHEAQTLGPVLLVQKVPVLHRRPAGHTIGSVELQHDELDPRL